MTKPVDIRPADLEIVRAILREGLPSGAKVWVFGSRATWATKDSSDLDLAIDAGRKLSLSELSTLNSAFEESDLPYRVDLVDWHTTSEAFRKIIERDRVELSSPDTGTPKTIKGFRPDTRFHWPLVQMGDVVSLHYGKALTADARHIGNVPVYGANGQTGWHNSSLAEGPTVILGRKGVGNLGVEWCKGPFWVIDTAYYVNFREGVDPRFFYFFTKFVGINHLKDGTSKPSLSRDTFYRQFFPLPPMDEQKGISSFLGDLDDKIDLNRRMNETLEAMAQAIFKDRIIEPLFDRIKANGLETVTLSETRDLLLPELMSGEIRLREAEKALRAAAVAADTPSR